MSRFSAESWRLTLAPDAWHLAGADASVVVPVGDDPAGALDALATLGDRTPVRKGRLAVEIADAWLRYLVIEWPLGLRGGAERAAWVSERFRAVHGVDAAEWVLGVDRAAQGTAALTSAAPRALIDAVTRFAGERRMRLTSLQGRFVAGYNRLRTGSYVVLDADLCADLGAFGLCRDGRLTLGMWAGGQWCRVRSLRVADGDAAPLLVRTLAGWLPAVTAEPGQPGGAGKVLVQGVDVERLMGTLPEGWRAQACGEIA
ncbi:MAG: hypothetical protein J0M28_02625 [Thauera sp.]|nr:hypothetical protein [Thauera sp.]